MHIFLKGDYYIELRSWGAYSLFLIWKLWCHKHKKLENGLLYMVPTSPGKSWNLKRGLESPGILLKFWKSPWKVLNFLRSNSPKEIAKKTPAFFGLLLHIESSSSLTNCCDFHMRYIGCNNVYRLSAYHWVTIFKFAIKSANLELRNCMSNPSATGSVLFDSSPFGTC